MRDENLTGQHASYSTQKYTAAENQRFTQQFNAITEGLRDLMQADVLPVDPAVQDLISQHYEFCLQFWQPNRESYISLATSYLLPSGYRDTYENVAPGLAKYHYDAIVHWANKNLD